MLIKSAKLRQSCSHFKCIYQFAKNLHIVLATLEEKPYLSDDKGGFLLDLPSLPCVPPAPLAISPLPFLPSSSFFICQFLSLPSLSLSLPLSFSPYAKFLRTLVAERERVYRSIAERPRSRLLLLLEVRSWLAGFFLPPSLPRNFLFFSSCAYASAPLLSHKDSVLSVTLCGNNAGNREEGVERI